MTAERTFTATVEATHAASLRAERDRTDADIRDDFIQRIDADRIASVRAASAVTRGYWEREAVTSAIQVAFNEASQAAKVIVADPDDEDATTHLYPLDLDGATITVTVADLIATATVTVPTLN